MIKEFRDFLFRGNIVELAVAFVMASRSQRRSTRS
jgi:large-conductance mechanosensitive channel